MLSKRMMHKHKDGVYYMSRDTVAKHVAQLEAEVERVTTTLELAKGYIFGWMGGDIDAYKRFEDALQGGDDE